MKLKSSPEDFRVEEITKIQTTGGQHAFYRLTKEGLGTPEAISEVLSRWNIERRRISYGGLKDRHAATTQYFSIQRGPTTGFTDRSMEVEYMGQIARPYHARDIASNRFEITLRKIPDQDRERLDRNAKALANSGAINYFDDQRFGSIGESGELIGEHWCKCNYERALFIALAERNPHDRPREKEQKEILRSYWGDWNKCKAMLDRSHRRSIVTYLLDHPTDFKRALALVRQDLRGIYIAAFQSWIWNRWLSLWIEEFNQNNGGSTSRYLASKSGRLALPELFGDASKQAWATRSLKTLPLPSARQHQWPEGTFEQLEQVVAGLGLGVRELRLKYPRDTFFSRGDRDIALDASGFQATWERGGAGEGQADWNWLLRFELPRGCYATMIVRQLFLDESFKDSIDTDEVSDEEDQEHEGGDHATV